MPYHHFFNHSSGGSSSFWGAFLGAFFAFVFGFITYIVTRRRERFVQHKNALIKLERVLLKHLNDLATLETLANGIKKNASESNIQAIGYFHWRYQTRLTLSWEV